jgi:hypothetical protein
MMSFIITAENIQHNLDKVNYYRGLVGAPPLQLDQQLSAYAEQGSQELLRTHIQHGHHDKNPIGWETQSYIYGWPLGQVFNGQPPAMNVNEQIDKILAQMWAEGPPSPGTSNHYSIMTDPNSKRLGVGLVINPNDLLDPKNPNTPASFWRGSLYLTNDFIG